MHSVASGVRYIVRPADLIYLQLLSANHIFCAVTNKWSIERHSPAIGDTVELHNRMITLGACEHHNRVSCVIYEAEVLFTGVVGSVDAHTKCLVVRYVQTVVCVLWHRETREQCCAEGCCSCLANTAAGLCDERATVCNH